MGNIHVCVNSRTTNIQIKAAFKTKGQLNSGVKHNKRLGKEGDKANIDKRRSYLNEEVMAADADQIYLNLVNRLTGKDYTKETVPIKTEIKLSNGRSLRKDAVLAFEIETSYPGDMVWSRFDENGNIVPVEEDVVIDESNISQFFKMPLDRKEFREWKEATVEFIKTRYGEDNILSVQVHMDEDEPHIHAIGVPIYVDERGQNRLSCSKFVGGPKEMAELQTAYADHVAYLGYKRGERFSSRLSNISTKEYKFRLNQAVNREMPETMEGCIEEIKKLRIKNFDLEQEMSQTMSSAKTIQKQRQRNNELLNENRQLRNENQELALKNEEMSKILAMIQSVRVAERLGCSIWYDGLSSEYGYSKEQADEIWKNYRSIQGEIENSGMDYLASAYGNADIHTYPETIDRYFDSTGEHGEEDVGEDIGENK